jgi:hypothetical protein
LFGHRHFWRIVQTQRHCRADVSGTDAECSQYYFVAIEKYVTTGTGLGHMVALFVIRSGSGRGRSRPGMADYSIYRTRNQSILNDFNLLKV